MNDPRQRTPGTPARAAEAGGPARDRARVADGERLLEEAERSERVGDHATAAVALRGYIQHHPEDVRARLRFAAVLMTLGERSAARTTLAPIEAAGAEDTFGREAMRRLAELDEAEGAVIAAAERWERILADDIDDPQARTRLALLRPTQHESDIDSSQTLASPAGVDALRFRLLRELGRGATATVYLARDGALGLDVALKVLHPQLAGSGRSDALRRFFTDARVTASIRHPGVVAIYDVDENARAVAMELVAGGRCGNGCANIRAACPPTSCARPRARCWTRSTTSTPPASFTATSSRRTCCCAGRARWCSPISAPPS